MLRLINEYRRVAGVPPVLVDPKLAQGCSEHARYMVLNRGKPQMYSINAHRQDPSLPGATPAGAECGKRAVLYPSINDLRSAVRGWMGTIYHRAPIIAPNIDKVGIGSSRLPTSIKRLAVALRFVYGRAAASAWPVAYPANGQTNLPINFVSESPTPIPPAGSATPGYPFTLQFPPYDSLTNISGTLKDAAGKPVPIYFSSPEKVASKYNNQLGLVAMIPQQTLRAGTSYTASVTATWKGKRQTWTSKFSTIKRRVVDATDEKALLESVGLPIRIRGVVKRTSRFTAGLIHIKLEGPAGPPRTRPILTLDVQVPRHILLPALNLPKNTKYFPMRGKTVEIDGTPAYIFRTLRVDTNPQSRIKMLP